MHSYEDRMKAVNLYIQYDFGVSATLRELGYPTPKTLRRWYREYVEEGNVLHRRRRNSKYSDDQKQKAVEYYLEHGRSIGSTVKVHRWGPDNWEV